MPQNVVVSEDLTVVGDYVPHALAAGPMSKTFGEYEVTLSTSPSSLAVGSADMLSFTIAKGGKPVTDLEPYLAALGHSVILKEDTLEYIHAHAIQAPTVKQNGTIDFHTEFPSSGMYKVFTQFKHAGQVVTTDFVVSVASAAPQSVPVMDMGTMHH